jgi:DNA-binding NarL/FixJ family response regulator
MPRILIVDDHAFIRRGIKDILVDFVEFEVCGEAENGQDAVRLGGELKPDVVLMDVSMPGMSGVEAARAILKNEPSVRVILVTLHDSHELIRNAFQMGVKGYLLKADAERELIRALRAVTSGGIYVSPKIDKDFVEKVIRTQQQNSVAYSSSAPAQ